MTEEESGKETPANPPPEPVRDGKPAPAAESMLPMIIVVLMLVLLGGGIWWVARKGNNGAADQTAASTSSSASSPRSDPVIASVDGMDIHESDFNAAVELIPENMRAPLATPVGKKRLTEELIRMKLLSKEAKRLKADEDPLTQARINVSTENILSNAAVEKLLQQTPGNIQELYNRNKGEFETAKTRQIMVAYQGGAVPARKGGKVLTEAEAQARAAELAAKIRGGADFAQVAKAESDEPGVEQSGGEIGEVHHGSLPPEIEKTIFSLPVNQISDPVKSQYAFHIFQVTGKETKSFEEIKPVLEKQGQQLRIKNIIDDLRSKAKVTYSPTFLPAALTATP